MKKVRQLVDGIWRDLGRRDPEYTFHLANLGQVFVFAFVLYSVFAFVFVFEHSTFPISVRRPSGLLLTIFFLMFLPLETLGIGSGSSS